MFRSLLLLITLLSTCGSALIAQNISVACGDSFFDSGGASGDYASNENATYTICPTVMGEVAFVAFTAVDLEECCDFLSIYNGDGTTDLLAEVTGPTTTFASSAADGCLTVVFTSDSSVEQAGFEATSSCGPPPSCPRPTNLNIQNVTTSSITAGWTEAGSASVYDVYLVPAGMPVPANPTAEDVSNPHTFTGLNSNTSYDIYVRADCDAAAGDDESLLAGPVFASTAPDAAADECIDATPIAVSPVGNCNPETFTDENATASNPANTDCTDPLAEDVWFSFSPLSTSVVIEVTGEDPFGGDGEGGGSVSREFEVFSGTCGAPLSLGCTERITNLDPAETYFIRVPLSVGFGGNGPFTICIRDQFAPPVNDDCSAATELIVSAEPSCTGMAATTRGANQSLLPNCGGTSDDDVWFWFVATNTTQLLFLTDQEDVNPGSFDRDLYFEVFSGACGGLSSLQCERFASFDDPPVSIPGLTVGDEYFLRVYSEGSSSQVDFNICLSTPPVNDECEGAIDIPVNPTAACDQFISSSTVGSTVSGGTCGIATNNGDVWFTFTATAEKHLLRAFNLEIVSGGRFIDLFYELSEGGCDAASLMVIECDALTSAFVVEAPNLTVGTQYHLRIWTRRFSTTANFDICVATPPANDECAGAFVAAVNPDLTNTLTTAGTSFGATRTFEIAAGDTGCSPNSNDDDIWFRFTALAEEHRVSLLNLSPVGYDARFDDTDGIVRIYPAGLTCASSDELDCGFPREDDDEVVFSGLTPGADYFLNIHSQNFNNGIAFDLSIKTEPSLLPVELTSFTGKTMEKTNKLEWEVALEESFSHYEVQRSVAGASDWVWLSDIQGAGAGAGFGTARYTFEDVLPPATAYYRLRSVDLDGSYALSNIVVLNRATSRADIRVYPNPSSGRFQVDLPLTDAPVTFTIYAMDGRMVATAQNPELFPRLGSGVYQLLVEAGSERWRKRVVVR